MADDTVGRKLKKALIGLGTVVAVLALVATVLYFFGTMESPSAEMRTAYQEAYAAGLAPAVTPAGFHIPIPGCRCHSTDPVLTLQHEGRTISQCSGCHSRG
jgi:hypothetical protein